MEDISIPDSWFIIQYGVLSLGRGKCHEPVIVLVAKSDQK